MSDEELQMMRHAIREELAQLTKVQSADAVRLTRLEGTAQTLLAISQNLAQVASGHADSILGLTLAHAELTKAQARTDAQVRSLAASVERFITARNTNGGGPTSGD